MMIKQEIMQKALELFAENGIQNTSVQQITDSCHISKGAFYLHFTSKDELILEVVIHYTNIMLSHIEQAVSDDQHKENLLYNYFYAIFTNCFKHIEFAHLLMKELMTSHNVEIIEKLKSYHWILNKIIHSIVKRQFHYTNHDMHVEISFIIQGFTHHYSSLFLFPDFHIDIKNLCEALVEKVTVLAEHTTIPVIKPAFMYMTETPTKEDIMKLMDEAIKEVAEDKLILDSLNLLRENLMIPTLNEAIIRGLLKNIKVLPKCLAITYLYEIWLDEGMR